MLNSSFHRRSGSSRETLQSSSVPISVTRLSSHTGMVVPPASSSVAGNSVSIVATSSISPLQSSTI